MSFMYLVKKKKKKKKRGEKVKKVKKKMWIGGLIPMAIDKIGIQF